MLLAPAVIVAQRGEGHVRPGAVDALSKNMGRVSGSCDGCGVCPSEGDDPCVFIQSALCRGGALCSPVWRPLPSLRFRCMMHARINLQRGLLRTRLHLGM